MAIHVASFGSEEKTSRVGNKDTTPWVFGAPAFGGGFFLRRPLRMGSKSAMCIRLNDTGVDPPPIRGLVATATNNVHLASARRRSPGQGTGTWISEEPQMTLTYRGQKYDQQKVAGTSDKPALTYRGVSYAK